MSLVLTARPLSSLREQFCTPSESALYATTLSRGFVGKPKDSHRNVVELRYSPPHIWMEMTKIVPEHHEVAAASMSPEAEYQKLGEKGMPVSHWDQAEFCASPKNAAPSDWLPALTLQNNWLRGGALVMCWAFQH